MFCRYQDKLIKQNQAEIIVQFTMDTQRSNVLYLFQTEGAKEFLEMLDECRKVDYHGKISSSSGNKK